MHGALRLAARGACVIELAAKERPLAPPPASDDPDHGGLEPAAFDMLARARALAGPEEARLLYRDWAETYDADVFGALRVTGSDRIADLLAAALPDRRARVIDLGGGTGHVAERLRRHGFADIDGLDLSPEMLAVALRRGLYRTAIVADLNQPLAIASASYDAAVSAGTFTSGHVGPRALGEVCRIVRPGGLIAAVIADAVWRQGGFEAELSRHCAAGRFSILANTHEPIVSGGEPQARFLVCRVGD